MALSTILLRHILRMRGHAWGWSGNTPPLPPVQADLQDVDLNYIQDVDGNYIVVLI